MTSWPFVIVVAVVTAGLMLVTVSALLANIAKGNTTLAVINSVCLFVQAGVLTLQFRLLR